MSNDINSNLQGDVSYDIRKIFVSSAYIDFELTIFSERFSEVDVAFEYRLNDKDTWKEDALVIQTGANYLKGNCLYGLMCSSSGSINLIRWQYPSNNLVYGSNIEIKIRVLPRIRNFGNASNFYSISEYYGEGLNNFNGQSRHNCIGIDNSGNYMCLGRHSFYIIEGLDAAEESTSSESSNSFDESSSSFF